ncbi:heme exporter protein CcmD [Halomonas eurihalina]|uniref:Heme exporter protein D n=1 Tax=Halomonas eurihalina TaxID=42566 RepID=A0A5D9D7B1_HALER|nr:heme exporter protein CcmD [Halomonas eurihalina]MDR5858956.1 heme exporter protein CcmD [Halomonas eurihalina]TZG39459.1 heme exporter protein CcmD [Halomonas eurihalina]
MAFDSFAAFLAMGGHAAYVWPAYGATLLLLIGVVLHLRLERRRLWRELRRRARRERRQAGDANREVSS